VLEGCQSREFLISMRRHLSSVMRVWSFVALNYKNPLCFATRNNDSRNMRTVIMSINIHSKLNILC